MVPGCETMRLAIHPRNPETFIVAGCSSPSRNCLDSSAQLVREQQNSSLSLGWSREEKLLNPASSRTLVDSVVTTYSRLQVPRTASHRGKRLYLKCQGMDSLHKRSQGIYCCWPQQNPGVGSWVVQNPAMELLSPWRLKVSKMILGRVKQMRDGIRISPY